jgi:NAD(P)-dependent dehydrogenase (short-subunit alcohol dehydrogenase family)
MEPTRGVALVTGGARRIGRAIALRLASEGWAVAIHHHRSAAEAQRLADEIGASGGRAACAAGDLVEEGVAARLVREASHLGPVALLVNNASCFEPDEMGKLTPMGWDRHLDCNLKAPVFLAQAFAAALPAGASGNIVNIVDQRVLKPNPRFFSYSVSKAGLWWATRTMAQALGPRIRVNAIGPGPAMASKRMSEEDFRAQSQATLLKRGTSGQEIAEALLFILATPSMTGQMIALDGGQHLLWRTPDLEGME